VQQLPHESRNVCVLINCSEEFRHFLRFVFFAVALRTYLGKAEATGIFTTFQQTLQISDLFWNVMRFE
jgi:hypothetical protein